MLVLATWCSLCVVIVGLLGGLLVVFVFTLGLHRSWLCLRFFWVVWLYFGCLVPGLMFGCTAVVLLGCLIGLWVVWSVGC